MGYDFSRYGSYTGMSFGKQIKDDMKQKSSNWERESVN